jgi:hypothetical protein
MQAACAAAGGSARVPNPSFSRELTPAATGAETRKRLTENQSRYSYCILEGIKMAPKTEFRSYHNIALPVRLQKMIATAVADLGATEEQLVTDGIVSHLEKAYRAAGKASVFDEMNNYVELFEHDLNPDKEFSIVRNRIYAIKYIRLLIESFEEIIDRDRRRHNEPPPEFLIENDHYLDEIHNLVMELRHLNELLERNAPQAQAEATTLGKHFDKFLEEYSGAMGKLAAGLTGGAVIAVLYYAGVGKDLLETLWGHLKLPK